MRIVQVLDQTTGFQDALQDALGVGYRVAGVSDPAPAARAQVLIADLPTQGLTAIAELRSRYPEASLVLLAFYDHHYQANQSLIDRIADAVVLKPVDFDGLAHTVRRLAEHPDPHVAWAHDRPREGP